ncbi:outer membrane lipoprotein carrier protein LolA [Nisaea acidiphila]|uniref:Outer membrane lipoprotein carrier protein LolA n=1 Tax=Nisaea acidiphila TaxID=1862145 RepID=A0A9J7ALG2_9PROT|nr:outer membrane lipoprotein carrier protein LolA [Nisaea acidiphila]UUX47998.1 outer membrane lipoprotein carrier protein LolA [Nisaea acidiphila]
MKKFLVLAALTACILLPQPSWAPPLSAADKEALKKVEAYFNGLTTLQARFLQVSSQGATAQGILSLKRPGRMRFEYDPPSPVLLVSDGIWLIFQDNELQQTTHVPLGSTPLAVLVEDPVDLTGNLEVLDVRHDPGVIRLLMRMRDDPEAGFIQMVFSDAPMELRQWTITDAQGIEVKVALLETRKGMKLEDDLFKPRDFESGNFVDK